MENINRYLEKFQQLTLPNEKIRKTISGVIEEELQTQIDFKDILVSNKIAYIKGGSNLKSEIFQKKEKILGKIEQYSGKKQIIDIK